MSHNTVQIDTLHGLTSLGPQQLHQEASMRSKRLAGAEWEMAICLLAVQRTNAYWTLGYSSTVQYAVQALYMSAHKAAELLRAATALEALPELAEAFREGRVCWSKLREITRVVTAETEHQWLQAALTHTAEEIQRAVSQSPSTWKRENQRTVEQPLFDSKFKPTVTSASCTVEPNGRSLVSLDVDPENEPSNGRQDSSTGDSTVQTDQQLLPIPEQLEGGPSKPAADDGTVHKDQVQSQSGVEGGAQAAAGKKTRPEQPPMPVCEKLIRFTVVMTSDEYAVLERALNKARGKVKKGKRRKEQALMEVANGYLNSGKRRCQPRHQVIVHYNAATEVAWYESQRGTLPVDDETLQQALTDGSLVSVEGGLAVDHAGLPTLSAPAEASELAESKPESATSLPEPRTSPSSSTWKSSKSRKRTAIPASVIRAVVARSSGRCERCDYRGPLHFHHKKPWSRVPEHTADNIELVCAACHTRGHEPDFAEGTAWKAAREHAMRPPKG